MEGKRRDNRRQKRVRNLFSYENRRVEPQENGGYPPESLCPKCQIRPTGGKVCRDCIEKDLRNKGKIKRG